MTIPNDIGAIKNIKPGTRYEDLPPHEQQRVDRLFDRFPMEKQDISVNLSSDDILKNFSGEDGKRILTRMVVVWGDPKMVFDAQMICNRFQKDIEQHVWKLGYEIDWDFPRPMYANKVLRPPNKYGQRKWDWPKWFIFAVSKKDPSNRRDIYDKPVDLQQFAKDYNEKERIRKDNDFTKL